MTTPEVKVTGAKAIAAGVGLVLNSLAVFWASVSIAAENDAFDFAEIGGLVTAAATLVGTVVAVYKTVNKPVR